VILQQSGLHVCCWRVLQLKWIAEYADLHGITMAPHGAANGLLGFAALIQV
jgi:L-alanine-DL-glutamate epimerase-like enolase superfamily enzyme